MKPFSAIDAIVLKFIRDEWLSADERTQLHQWLCESDDRKEMIDRLMTDPDWVKAELARIRGVRTEAIWSDIESRLKPLAPIPSHPQTGRRRWLFTAAASFMLILGAAGIWYSSSRSHQPGANKAILTLSDGRRIDVGSSPNGAITDQASPKVAKVSDGQIVYTNAMITDQSSAIAYHTLTTPRSGQFKLRLSDGTQVWLNNASALRYPLTFTGLDRTVELNGEAYFEVAKDPAHPFHVKISDGSVVEVLGTSFNVMAYTDEPADLTTLIDGSVRVIANNQTALLKQAEQSVFDDHGKLRVTPNVNVREVIAWKNGYFHFNHTSLQATMRQLARWYDVDIVYEANLPHHEFVGRIQRSLPLQEILKGLDNDDVHFTLQGRKLLVTP